MTKPSFSIITVTLNNHDGLQKTAASIIPHLGDDIEWLIIDGASTDDTPELLKTLPAKIISEPDNGLYDAMNKGIENSSGRYMIFMNAGDCFPDNEAIAAILYAVADTDDAPDFLYGDAYEDTLSGKIRLKTARSHKNVSQGLFTHHQAIIYKRDQVYTLRYDGNYPIAADYKFTLQALQRAEDILYIQTPLCIFEAGGISQTQFVQGRQEQFEIREELSYVSPMRNRLIYLRQSTGMIIRRFLPPLYWLLRRL